MTADTRPAYALRIHDRASVVPFPDPDQHGELVDDIAEHGIQVPLDILDDGTILDGRTRYAIAKALGIADLPVRVVRPDDPVAYMVRMATKRRHLSPATRKALAARLLAEDPSRSDRGIATATGLDHKTVAAVRSDAVGRGDIPHVSERTDSLGRQQPATKPERSPETEPDPWDDALADPETVDALETGLREVATGQTVARPPRPVTPPRDPSRPPADATRRIARAHLFEALQSARGNADLAHPLTDEDRQQVAIHLDYIRWRCLGDAPALREVSHGS